MTSSVLVPVWLLVLIVLFAAVTFASHFLFPSVRWFFRGRMEKAVARLNTKLQRPIEPFRLMRRQDKIVRLIYDPEVIQAVSDHARDSGVPPNVVLQEAKSYAREIVPGFSTLLYFGVAIRLARWLSRQLYRVRIGRVNRKLHGIDPDATVIFVINHRSNMDYVLLTWLVAERSALSFAVGEWARVWPLSRLLRAIGAYFVRRGSRNALYRRVLARYVQMATAEGTTQAMFPEGGLSLDGRVGTARMGLLHYIISGFDQAGRDVVFVPVGLAYDRVLEDRLLTGPATAGKRRFPGRSLAALRFVGRTIWRKLRGRLPGFGGAAAGFGAPLSLRDWQASAADTSTQALGAELMTRIRHSVPVLPVPLLAAVIVAGPVTRGDLPGKTAALRDDLRKRGATLRLPPGDRVVEKGLALLMRRGIIAEGAGGYAATPGNENLLQYYAAAVLQEIEAPIPPDAATRQT